MEKGEVETDKRSREKSTLATENRKEQ